MAVVMRPAHVVETPTPERMVERDGMASQLERLAAMCRNPELPDADLALVYRFLVTLKDDILGISMDTIYDSRKKHVL